jgi:hypothetical protein
MAVRPSACISAAYTGRIYVKFRNGDFYETAEKIQISLKSGSLHKDPKYTYVFSETLNGHQAVRIAEEV